MMKFARGMVAASAIAMTSVVALAATAPQVVKVSLDGEAGSEMTIKIDQVNAKAGLVDFDISNDAIGTDHEMVLIKLTSKDQKLVADPKTHKLDESQLVSMGEVAGLKPGATKHLKVKLAAGDYVLMCNHKEHIELGMQTPFTVTQ